jgi:hypothetical protein
VLARQWAGRGSSAYPPFPPPALGESQSLSCLYQESGRGRGVQRFSGIERGCMLNSNSFNKRFVNVLFCAGSCSKEQTYS